MHFNIIYAPTCSKNYSQKNAAAHFLFMIEPIHQLVPDHELVYDSNST